jgi:MFS family permease
MKKTDSNDSRLYLLSARFFRGNIAVIASSNAVNGFGTGIFSTYVSYYFTSIGGDSITLGLMVSLSSIIQCLMLWLGGFIADRYGRRKVIVVAAFYAVLFPALYALIRDWRIFIVVAIMGAFAAVSSPASHAIVADSIPAEKRTTGISTLQVASTFPMVFSPLIAGWLIKVYGLQDGFRLACVCTAGTALISAVILLLFLKETKLQKAGQTSKATVNSIASIRANLSTSSLNSLTALLVSYGLIAFANGLVGYYYSLYAKDVIGITAVEWGIITFLQLLLPTFLKIPGGWASDRFGKKKVMMISILACTPFAVLFTFSHSFLQAAIVMVLLMVTGMYYAPSHEALQADLTSTEVRGRVTAFWDISAAVATALGAPLGGFLFQTINPAVPFYAFAVIEVAAALLILVAVKEPRQAEDSTNRAMK